MADTAINNAGTHKEEEEELTIDLDRRFDPQMVIEKINEATGKVAEINESSVKIQDITQEAITYALKIKYPYHSKEGIVTRVWNELWDTLNELDPDQKFSSP